jgi:hypothetical protein
MPQRPEFASYNPSDDEARRLSKMIEETPEYVPPYVTNAQGQVIPAPQQPAAQPAGSTVMDERNRLGLTPEQIQMLLQHLFKQQPGMSVGR